MPRQGPTHVPAPHRHPPASHGLLGSTQPDSVEYIIINIIMTFCKRLRQCHALLLPPWAGLEGGCTSSHARMRGQSPPRLVGRTRGPEEVSSEGSWDLESGIMTGGAQNCSHSFPCFRVRLGCPLQQSVWTVLIAVSANLSYHLVPHCQTERGGVAIARATVLGAEGSSPPPTGHIASQPPPHPPSQRSHVLGSLSSHPALVHLHFPPTPHPTHTHTHSLGPCPQEL